MTGMSSRADFGNPLGDTVFDLCLYDKGTGSLRLLSSASASVEETCGLASCWRPTGKGYLYRTPVGPVQHLMLRSGRPGAARIVAHAGGFNFTLPAMPVAPPVLVRLRARDGLCWGANYSLPARNTSRRFSSRGDTYYP
jgi:hypothetical protein